MDPSTLTPADIDASRKMVAQTFFSDYARAQVGGLTSGVGAYSPQVRGTPDDLMKMIAMRMRWDNPGIQTFHHITAVRGGANVAVMVWSTPDAEPQILKDDWGLFPSDTLITQLRLLESK